MPPERKNAYPLRILRRRIVLAIVAALVFVPGMPARAQTPPPSPAPQPPAPQSLAKAWVLVDADSGAVLGGANPHESLPAASVAKLFTAILTVENLPPRTEVPVSPRAESMPARKINLRAGQRWMSDDLLHALLLVSANDAAVALAERIGGDEAAYSRLMERTARRLGMVDHPVLRDPAGLDDQFSYGGGNRISAHDLAILARAALASPTIASIVTEPDYRFTGGDWLGHHLLNHNRLLKSYPGAIGVKTGYTRRAGHCLIAAARRGGRTLVAVVLHAPDIYASAAALLDQGFATPRSAAPGGERLPRVVTTPSPTPAPAPALEAPVPRRIAASAPGRVVVAAPATRAAQHHAVGPRTTDIAIAVVGGLPAVAILLRRRRRPRTPGRVPSGGRRSAPTARRGRSDRRAPTPPGTASPP